MKMLVCTVFALVCGCTESGPYKGHAGAQASRSPVINEPAGADLPNQNFKNSIVYEDSYKPARNFESSVLNEPDDGSTNDAQGRGYRVNGSGYGFVRE